MHHADCPRYDSHTAISQAIASPAYSQLSTWLSKLETSLGKLD